MVEVMEPTDFVVRVEFNIGGSVIPEAARFMGRDIDFALDMFSYESWPLDVVKANWACRPELSGEGPNFRRESLVDQRLTDRFQVSRTAITQTHEWHSNGFTILVVLEGSCEVSTESDCVRLSPWDRIVVPHGLKTLNIHPRGHVCLLECSPPLTE